MAVMLTLTRLWKDYLLKCINTTGYVKCVFATVAFFSGGCLGQSRNQSYSRPEYCAQTL